MFKKTVPLNKQRHAAKKILPVNVFKFAEKSYIVSLIANEFTKAASAYPIVFVKDGEELRPFALLGLEKGQNMFVNEDGTWKSHYIPAIIRRYPFVLGRNEGSSDLVLCIDEESDFLSDTEGEPLFDEKGEPGPIIEKARNFLIELQRFNEMTGLFSKELTKRELLSPLKMQIRNNQGVAIKIDGIFGVNERKLNELPEADFMDLRKRGMLPLIYAHLISLGHIERLVQMQSENG
ncbi:SapC family protein [Desulfonema magnum]|uniref:SapC domain-containing protein n=1 Tax=Desulfonema magnum TaxID=45655 RepID=A0A975BMQ3_9BACT|nr:SapC family protein [Desulfonema magnum]QTA87849.1 SapC domain-containing protein [Desulfonema magnum]